MTDKDLTGLGFLNGGGEMGERIRTKDWRTTPIGAPATWPQSLRTTVSILLNSRFPMFVWWGPQLTTIYNDAYIPIAGEKHPVLLGESGSRMWAEIWDVIGPMAEQVMNAGVASWADDQLLLMNRHGYVEETYFTFSYSPIFTDDGKVGGLFCACTETTGKVLSARHLQQSEANFRNLVKQAPVAICIVSGTDYLVEIANERMLQFLGRSSDIIGRPIIEALPEARVQGLMQILDTVQQSGEPYHIDTFPATILIDGVREERFFDLIFKPYRAASEMEVSRIFCAAHNVTEQVIARQKLEESEQHLQLRVEERTADLQQQKAFISSILDASFNGIYSLKAVRNTTGNILDFEYLFANDNITKTLKHSSTEVVGNYMLQLIPENKNNGFFDLFCKVLETGKAVQDVTHFEASGIDEWYDYIIVPIDEDTLVVTTQAITAQKKAALQIEQQRNLLDNVMKHSPSGITVTEFLRDEQGVVYDGRTIVANAISEKFVGLPVQQLLQQKLSEVDPDMPSSDLFKNAVSTLETDEPFIMQYYVAPTDRWLELSVARMDADHVINVFTDITTIKKSELEIRESIERLAAVFNAAQSGMFTFKPEYNADADIVDFRFVITNSNFASYIGQTPEVLKGELGSTWFPGYLHNGVFDMYRQTFLTGKTQRQNVHYNVDGLDIYLDLMSTKVGNELLVTFTDYTQLQTVQLQLQRHIEELKRSNAILEEFAHAASHDLKEPVRKVQVFSDRLKRSLSSLSDEQNFLFDRVENATRRMSLLIDDLLDYSHVSMGIDMLEKVDLNEKLQSVIGDLEVAIQDKGATVTIGELPTVTGHRRQLQQLFHNLVQNALKYSKADVAPHITITADVVRGHQALFPLPAEKKGDIFYLIQVRDNGIGFDPEYAEKIFKMFQRLHGKSEYSGSGVGLAIVRKVVDNHKGFITAEGKRGEGATFKILLPVAE